jgi:hypothetical protein
MNINAHARHRGHGNVTFRHYLTALYVNYAFFLRNIWSVYDLASVSAVYLPGCYNCTPLPRCKPTFLS